MIEEKKNKSLHPFESNNASMITNKVKECEEDINGFVKVKKNIIKIDLTDNQAN